MHLLCEWKCALRNERHKKWMEAVWFLILAGCVETSLFLHVSRVNCLSTNNKMHFSQIKSLIPDPAKLDERLVPPSRTLHHRWKFLWQDLHVSLHVQRPMVWRLHNVRIQSEAQLVCNRN